MIPKSIRFLLVSRKTPVATQIKRELEKNIAFTVHHEETSKTAMDHIENGTIDYLIFNFDHFSDIQVKLVQDIRNLGHIFQIFIISETVSETSVEKIKSMDDVLVIQRETLDLTKDVPGMIKRISKGQKAFPRKYKRFQSYQRASLENMNYPDRKYGVMIGNLSFSGAYIEFSGAKLGEGDAVRLVVQMSRIAKTRIVFGRVMWVRKADNLHMAAGIHFDKAEEAGGTRDEAG